MKNALTQLRECAEMQKKIFLAQFMTSGKVGEITCINGIDNEDSILFERFEVNGTNFLVAFRLMSEDSVISIDSCAVEKPIEEFINSKNAELTNSYNMFLAKLEEEGKTLKEAKEELILKGGDATALDYKPLTRDKLEDSMHPGRRRINGDRNSRIQILHRQVEIPNDLQKSALEVFVLPLPSEVKDYVFFSEEEEKEAWRDANLIAMMRDEVVGCHLPLFKHVIDVKPIIYRFPEKELDVSRAAGI